MGRVARSANEMEGLAVRMAATEEEGYAEFADTFGPRLRAFFIKRGLGVTDAEDLAVSCVTDIALKIEKYQPLGRTGAFEGWVFTVARNYMIDWLRARKNAEPLSETLAAPSSSDDEDEIDIEVALAVSDAMGRLSLSEQAVVKLRYFVGQQNYAEIAVELGITPEAARVRHSRALKKLKTLLELDDRIRHRLSR